jgi:hypothetical protein
MNPMSLASFLKSGGMEPVSSTGSEWTDRVVVPMVQEQAGRVDQPPVQAHGRMVNPEYMQGLVQRPQSPPQMFNQPSNPFASTGFADFLRNQGY